MDANIYNIATHVAYKCIQKVNYTQHTFNSDEFVDKLTSFLSNGQPDEYSIDHLDVIGEHVMLDKFMPCLTSFSSIYGGLTHRPEPPPKVRKQKETNSQKAVKKHLIKVVDLENENDKKSEDILRFYMKALNDEYKKNDNMPVDYYKFVIDTEDFGLTVENIFYTSFILNDGKIKLTLVSVEYNSDGFNEEESSGDFYIDGYLAGAICDCEGRYFAKASEKREYASNMRMMFEHKYGVRKISEKPNWKQKIDKLGHAAVTFQMIQNTPQKTISLASKHHVIKDAAFVIYNGARISSILRRFESEIEKNTHNKLPTIENIDFSTLRLSEEWDLIYAFLAQFPDVIKKCVCDLPEGKLNFQKLYEFLVHFSTAFSVYYSRIKIITEAKEHLLPTMHARIYLLKSIERVLQNALKLLNIELVNQM
ncbi:uncharacterized protein [Atheta coriaria]|uniref:uncharacterized protein n=1 Tax=Dalotia coriaria TaxID=877792 RepID=UPI0031F4623C